MKQKLLAFLLTSAMLLTPAVSAAASEADAGNEQAAPDVSAAASETGEGDEQTDPDVSYPASEAGEGNEQAAPAVTQHSARIGGEEISYTAAAGTMDLDTSCGTCSMFYVAYTRDDTKDDPNRPITFAFNGGPGSSSEWIHMAFLGPRIIELDETGKAVKYPAEIIDNENSILDMSDLVFIDPVGTGYSRAAGSSVEEDFCSYENDILSVAEFIRKYINENNRWASPKYIAGESYGTVRAVGLAEYLSSAYGMGLNGLMLVSSINDFSTEPILGGDIGLVLGLPTFAADAWYHGKCSQQYLDMSLEEYMDEVRAFAGEEYMRALFMGRSIPEDVKDDIAQRMSDYLGISKSYVLEQNLRITVEGFCDELLKDQALTIGRIDGRFSGPTIVGDSVNGGADPSLTSLDIIFATAVNDYITRELEYKTEELYVPMSDSVNYAWDYNAYNQVLSQRDTIKNLMSKNTFLKIWVLCGYYDLATPFFAAEWVYNHVFLNEEQVPNLQFTYYPSGHMFYLNRDAFAEFRGQSESWYKQ